MHFSRITILTAFAFMALAVPPACATYMSTVLADNPAAYWRLGELSGATAVNVVNSPAGDGTYSGSFTLGRPGALLNDVNTAVGFNGGALQTSITTGNALFSGRTVLTFEFWVKPRAAQLGIHYMEYGGNSDFSLEGNSLSPNFFVNNIFIGNVRIPWILHDLPVQARPREVGQCARVARRRREG
jgi:hypothetical protein